MNLLTRTFSVRNTPSLLTTKMTFGLRRFHNYAKRQLAAPTGTRHETVRHSLSGGPIFKCGHFTMIPLSVSKIQKIVLGARGAQFEKSRVSVPIYNIFIEHAFVFQAASFRGRGRPASVARAVTAPALASPSKTQKAAAATAAETLIRLSASVSHRRRRLSRTLRISFERLTRLTGRWAAGSTKTPPRSRRSSATWDPTWGSSASSSAAATT